MPDKLTNIGTTIAVSTTLPATENVAGYGALTFTEVVGVGSIPEFGGESEVLTYVDVKDGVTQKAHGGRDFGGGTLSYRILEADAGQGILEDADDNQTTLAFKLTRSSGLIEYFQGIVTSSRTSEASSGNTYTRNSAIQASTAIIKDATGV